MVGTAKTICGLCTWMVIVNETAGSVHPAHIYIRSSILAYVHLMHHDVTKVEIHRYRCVGSRDLGFDANHCICEWRQSINTWSDLIVIYHFDLHVT